jgi:hypothetical protein
MDLVLQVGSLLVPSGQFFYPLLEKEEKKQTGSQAGGDVICSFCLG